MVRKIFRINLCLLLPEAKKKGGSILLTAGLPQNRSWRSIIPNWQLNGFLCFAFFDSIKRRSMARSLSQPHCKYFHYQNIQLFTVVWNCSWRSIIKNWELNGFLYFAFFDSIKRKSMAYFCSLSLCLQIYIFLVCYKFYSHLVVDRAWIKNLDLQVQFVL